jgi:hypothetical protein
MTPSQNKAAMQEHIPQWQASDLTQAEYCKIHDIKPHIFSYYKTKFSSAIPSLKHINPLVPIKLVAEHHSDDLRLSTGSSVIKVTHTNGFSLEVQANTDLSTLKPLLELVRNLS